MWDSVVFFGLICHWLGAKPAWLEAYRNHPKVLRMWEKGECGGGGDGSVRESLWRYISQPSFLFVRRLISSVQFAAESKSKGRSIQPGADVDAFFWHNVPHYKPQCNRS